MKHTTSSSAAVSPAKHAAPNPGAGSTHHARSQRRGQLPGAVGRAVVDHDRRVAGGHALEHPGDRFALVEHGQDDVGHGPRRCSLRAVRLILVTGGAGFIGSHVVDALLDAGREVRVLDALLDAAHRERPDYLDPRAELIEGDVRDPRRRGPRASTA